MNTADTDTTKYDADQDLNGKVEDVDLTIIVDQMLKNTNYTLIFRNDEAGVLTPAFYLCEMWFYCISRQ